jgi:hypothetical protein
VGTGLELGDRLRISREDRRLTGHIANIINEIVMGDEIRFFLGFFRMRIDPSPGPGERRMRVR